VALKNGNLKLNLKKQTSILKSNQLAIIKPFEIHSAIKIDKDSQDIFALYLDKLWIERFEDGHIGFTKNIIDDINLYNKFLQLCNDIFSKKSILEKEKLVIEFISKIYKKYKTKNTTKHNNVLVKDIQNYIDKNYQNEILIDNISNEFLITTSHLIRLFKKELGLTPYQYILNKRVNLAKKLISQNISIAEASLMCSFSDQSHLYKYFQQIFSITPKEYQNSLCN